MQGTTRQSRSSYRCPTRPDSSSGHPSSVHLREAVPVRLVDEWLAEALASEAREATAAELAARCGPTPEEQARIDAAQPRMSEIDRKLARLAEAFEAGLSPKSYASRDRRYRAEREAALREATPPAAGLSAEELRSALADTARLAERLGRATAAQRRTIYEALRLSLTWEAKDRTLRARLAPRGAKPGVGGPTWTRGPRPLAGESPWSELHRAA